MRSLKKRATNIRAKQAARNKVEVVFHVGGEYTGFGDKTSIVNATAKAANLDCPLTYRGIKKSLQEKGFLCEARHITLPDRDRKRSRRAKRRENEEEIHHNEKSEASAT